MTPPHPTRRFFALACARARHAGLRFAQCGPVGSVALAVALIAAACGQSATAPAAEVAAGSSDDEADAGAEGSRASDQSAEDAATAEPTCPAGCVAVSGYAQDPDRGCADRTRLGFVGCDCNPSAAFSRCGRRVVDGALWVFRAGELHADSEFTECDVEESLGVLHACDFADCAVSPLAICSLEATCAERGCDNFEFDAQGCRRTSCESDAECVDDERCVQLACVTESSCSVANAGPDETCGCAAPSLCRGGGVCNPVTTAGPRGAWHRLTVHETNLVCAAGGSNAGDTCSFIRSVDRSGTVETTPMHALESSTAVLTEERLARLTQWIDGPSLRLRLRDGFDCGPPGGDLLYTLTLELSDATLSQNITFCGDVIMQLQGLLAGR